MIISWVNLRLALFSLKLSHLELAVVKILVLLAHENWNDEESDTNYWNEPSDDLERIIIATVGLAQVLLEDSPEDEGEDAWVDEFGEETPVESEDWLPPHLLSWVWSTHLRTGVSNLLYTTHEDSIIVLTR